MIAIIEKSIHQGNLFRTEKGAGMPEDPNEKLVRDFQDRIVQGCYRGIYGLDEAGLERVMECQADACAHAFLQLFGIPDDLDLDAFLEKMKLGGSSKSTSGGKATRSSGRSFTAGSASARS
jgi:hypothetical protein